jgi:hypothetical protein
VPGTYGSAAEGGQVVARDLGVRVIGPHHSLEDGQRLLIGRPRPRQVSLGAQHIPQVVVGRCRLWMVLSVDFSPDSQRPPVGGSRRGSRPSAIAVVFPWELWLQQDSHGAGRRHKPGVMGGGNQ